MIIDKSWNPKEKMLSISYLDKDGNRQLYKKNLNFIKTYEYDENGEYNTWNNKKCNKVYKDASTYKPNEFDILEHMYDMAGTPNEHYLEEFHAHNPMKVYTYDIETEFEEGVFPEPELAEQRVTSISLVGPDLSVIVYGLKSMNKEELDRFRQRYIDFIKNNHFASILMKRNNKEPKVLYQSFNTEQELLKHWFNVIIPKIGILAGWNSYRFDRQYLVNRIIRLFGKSEAYNMVRNGSPTRELSKVKWQEVDGSKCSTITPMHMAEVDYMEIIKKYEYAFRPYESYSLDWCGQTIVGANKIKYSGTLQDLYEKDYEWYYYYNAIDSLIVQLIHQRTKCLKSPAAVASLTLVPLLGALGQVALSTANIFSHFYADNRHVVYNFDEIDRNRVDYEGAFCACAPGRRELAACFDFKSLYPTCIRTVNLSFENFMQAYHEKDSLGRQIPRDWYQEELEEFRKHPDKYFVTNQNHVYKNDKDYAFKRCQTKNTIERDKYKYTGQKIDSELLTEIDRLITEKSKSE